MPALDRVQRAVTSSDRPVRRSSTPRGSKPANKPRLGNQATLNRLQSQKRSGKESEEQSPDTAEGKADRLIDRFDADPADQAGRSRAEVAGMPPEERGDVLGRVEDKVSQTEFGRMAQVLAEPGPLSLDAPPKKVEPSGQSVLASAGREEPLPSLAGEVTGESRDSAAVVEAEQGEPAEETNADESREQRGEQSEARRDKRDRGRGAPPGQVGKKRPGVATEQGKRPQTAVALAPAQGQRSPGEAAKEEATRDASEGEKVAQAAQADAAKTKPEPATASAGEGETHSAQALAELPAAAAAEVSQTPAAPGAPARQAASRSAPAIPAPAAAGGGGGGGSDAEAALEPDATSGGEQEAESGKTDDRMAEAEGTAPAEEEEPAEPEPALEQESTGDPNKPPSAEDQELIHEAERERQEEVRAPRQAAEAAESEGEEEPASAERAELNPAMAQAGLESLAEGGGAEPAGGGGGGGGAVTEQPAPEPPQVEGLPPVGAMSAAKGLKVGQISKTLAGVRGSVSDKMTGERADLAANAPSMERPSGAPQTREAPIDFPGSATGEEASVEETPEGETIPVEEPVPLPDPGPAPTDQVAAPAIQGGGEGGTLTEAEAANIESAVEEVPTSDPALEQTAGPAPSVELAGDADPQQAADQRAALDESLAAQQEQGAQDVAQPMGENEIYPVVPQETLTATIPSDGGAGAGGAPPEVDDETTAIVAEEKQGDEVRASVDQASTDMQAGEEDHATQTAEAQAEHETKVQELEEQNAGRQSDRRSAAATAVEQERTKWSQGQQRVADKAQGDADSAQETMSTEVDSQTRQGNEKAAAEIEKGNSEAADLKTAAEKDARQEKAKAREESSGGILGWIASKAKAFFEGLKKAVKAVFDLAREALKALIDGVKKLAAMAIEAARGAIVAAIRDAGDTLILIGNVALVAFPELRDRFCGYIEDKVHAAEDAVNELADDLKTGIDSLLDLLGSALNSYLNLLETVWLAAIDYVAGQVQSAMNVAQAAIGALGLLAALIKDIAAGPTQWLSNLGAAIVDGIQNHLWKAFKAAVKSWFLSKLEQVIGIGKAIFDVLLKGGIQLAEVSRMAFEGLKAAIPAALIAILIEKLVAMIVPAAGAVMAIIEGLQAAWGAISQLLQAIGKFVDFLKAVKVGGAGARFADALAAGAIVVIDFVSNWLIRKIRGPASKIGGKIKAIARKIMEKLKAVAKKIGRAVKRAVRTVVRKVKRAYRKAKDWVTGKRRKKGKAKQRDDERRKRKKERKTQEAIAKTKAAVASMLSGGTRPLFLKGRLAYLKLRYGWRSLAVEKQGRDSFRIAGSINPNVVVEQGETVADQVNVIRQSSFTVSTAQAGDWIGFQAAVVRNLTRKTPSGETVAGPSLRAIPDAAAALAGQNVELTPEDQRKKVPKEVDPRLRDVDSSMTTGPVVREDPKLPRPRGTTDTPGADMGQSRPEAIVEMPDTGEILVVEATLDVSLTIKKKGSRGSHKKIQIPNTILNATRFYTQRPLRLTYAIYAPAELPDKTEEYLRSVLCKMQSKGVDLRILWIPVPTKDI
jgi:hypothetical protein